MGRLTEGEIGSYSVGQGHAQYIFNPIFCWWVGLCSFPVIYTGANYEAMPKNTQTTTQLHSSHMLVKWKKVKVKSLSRIGLFVTPWTVAYQAPPSMGFSRQEYWSGLPFPSPGDLPDPGIEPGSPSFQADALTSELLGKPIFRCIWYLIYNKHGFFLGKCNENQNKEGKVTCLTWGTSRNLI